MKFKFSKNLDYQKEAIDSIVEIFDIGKNIAQSENTFVLQNQVSSIIANELEADKKRILQNIQAIQRNNKIDPITQVLDTLDFCVEMETGTGKTYVYLRTILELNQKYGLKKFIILVPSVAIREGVLKTIEQTKDHFRELYNTGFGYFAYDSSKLSKVREFAQSIDIQIMIMTIQSFVGDDRVMRQTPDRFNGESPISLVAATRPVVIMDEPQNMGTDLSKAAIADLNPLFKLRYSATHKEIHNLMYRLTPVDAYKNGLVKKIQVFGVKGDDAGSFVFKVQSIDTKKGERPKAKVQLEIKNADGSFVKKDLFLKAGDSLEKKAKNNKYEGILVNDINAQYERVELSNGNYYKLEAETENKEAIFRTQIKETIKAHFDKQTQFTGRIKVLSLFFIDKVDNYVLENSLIKKIFTEEFESLKKNYAFFRDVNVDTVHTGYFASKKEKGIVTFKDTNGDSKLDKEAYNLIMRDKERLLSFDESVSFIFSHSALKEGWDNPNIFQICTLRETNSLLKKRQEIGRGLRLPVDVFGNRIYDSAVNILTVVANESYQEYVGKLQQEFKEAGYGETPETTDAREKKIRLSISKKYIADQDFIELWNKINKRTQYNLEINSDVLVRHAVEEINQTVDVSNLVVTVDKVNVYFDERGKMETIFAGQAAGTRLDKDIFIGNFVERIARETNITRKTIFDILSKVENLDLLFENPEEYIRSVTVIIKNCLNTILINDGLKYIPTNQVWEVNLLFKESECLESKSIASHKSPYERVLFDSDGERQFAQRLENSPNVRVYTKLPRGFTIDTPLGDYTPDWAVVWTTQAGEKIYLVRETKFGYSNLQDELSSIEKQKILCGERHFEAINFNGFGVSENPDLSDLLLNNYER